MWKKIILIFLIFFIFFLYLRYIRTVARGVEPTAVTDSAMYERLKGQIILQVEASGEAYYIHPQKCELYYLGRPQDAFDIMRALGLGITNKDFTRLTAPGAPVSQTPYSVGYRTHTFTITDSKEGATQIPVSFWYPTDSKPAAFVYKTVGDDLKPDTYTTSVAVSAPLKQNARPYPLVLFFHGAQTCGTQSVFFTEHLASQGFIVAAPDFPDDAPQCSSIGKKPASYFLLSSKHNKRF